VRDPRPASAPWSAPGRGRGWCGEEDDPVAGVADAWGPVVKRLARCGCVRRVMADGRVRLVSGCARERAGEAWLGELGRLRQAGLCCCLPPFPFLFLFVSLFFLLL